jgi:hypothetical protein
MIYARILALLLISNAAVCLSAAGQTECVNRSIPVNVSSSAGPVDFVLSASNILGTYRSRPVTINSVQIEERRPRVILLVDTSASMEMGGGNNAAFAEAILSKFPADMEVGLAFFATRTTPMVPPTLDHSKLLFPLEALRRGDYPNEGITALRSAVLDAIKMFGTPLLGDTVYLVSDGGENHSKAQEIDVGDTLGSSGIRLFALMANSQDIGIRSRTNEELDGPVLLRDLVRSGGGTMIPKFGTTGVVSDLLGNKATTTQLGKEVTHQIDQILNFYRVDITLQEPADKPRKLNLILTGLDKATTRKLEFIFPTVLGPCR